MRVRESAAARSLTAIAILKGSEHLANIYGYYTPSGACYVEVIDMREGLTHQSRQVGGNYDKFAAGLHGAVIDGHTLVNHCGKQLVQPPGGFPRDFEPPLGYTLANLDSETGTWRNCFQRDGVRYLQELGYTVINVL